MNYRLFLGKYKEHVATRSRFNINFHHSEFPFCFFCENLMQ
jgi:hypothetical protein